MDYNNGFNTSKCEVMHFGYNNGDHQYHMQNEKMINSEKTERPGGTDNNTTLKVSQ